MSSHNVYKGDESVILVGDNVNSALQFYDREWNLVRTLFPGFTETAVCTYNDSIILSDDVANTLNVFNIEGVQTKVFPSRNPVDGCIVMNNEIIYAVSWDGNLDRYTIDGTLIDTTLLISRGRDITRYNDKILITHSVDNTLKIYDLELNLLSSHAMGYSPRGVTRLGNNIVITEGNSFNTRIYNNELGLLSIFNTLGLYSRLHTRYFYHEG